MAAQQERQQEHQQERQDEWVADMPDVTDDIVADWLHIANTRVQSGFLTAEEERALAQRIHSGDHDDAKAALHTLVERNLLLVIGTAQHYATTAHLDWLPDLIQVGNIGLMTAATKYDPTTGYRFSTYATWWIRQAISREAQRQRRLVSIPGYLETVLLKVRRAEATLATQGIAQPTSEQVCALAGVTPEQYASVQRVPALVSLNRPADAHDGSQHGGQHGSDEDAPHLGDTLADPIEGTPEQQDALLAAIDAQRIWAEVATLLTPREIDILRAYYGHDYADATDRTDEQTLTAIGARLDISRARVGALRAGALTKLRMAYDLTPDGRLLRCPASAHIYTHGTTQFSDSASADHTPGAQ